MCAPPLVLNVCDGFWPVQALSHLLVNGASFITTSDCVQIGTKVAETLEDQTKQMERIAGDLDEIKFTLKKAEKVIRDITRSMATDK